MDPALTKLTTNIKQTLSQLQSSQSPDQKQLLITQGLQQSKQLQQYTKDIPSKYTSNRLQNQLKRVRTIIDKHTKLLSSAPIQPTRQQSQFQKIEISSYTSSPKLTREQSKKYVLNKMVEIEADISEVVLDLEEKDKMIEGLMEDQESNQVVERILQKGEESQERLDQAINNVVMGMYFKENLGELELKEEKEVMGLIGKIRSGIGSFFGAIGNKLSSLSQYVRGFWGSKDDAKEDDEK